MKQAKTAPWNKNIFLDGAMINRITKDRIMPKETKKAPPKKGNINNSIRLPINKRAQPMSKNTGFI